MPINFLRALLFVALVAGSSVAQMSTANAYFLQDDRLLWSALIAVASGLLAYGVGLLVQPDKRRRVFLLVPFVIVMMFATLDKAANPAVVVLAHRGVEVEATVVELRISRNINHENLHYKVAGPDGKRLPGEWTEGHAYRTPGLYRTPGDFEKDTWSPQPKTEVFPVGTVVTLVVDPEGQVHPHTPEEVADAGLLWVVGGAISLPAWLIALFAGGPLGRRR